MKTSKKRSDDTFGSLCFVYDYMVSLSELIQIYKEQNDFFQENDIKLILL